MSMFFLGMACGVAAFWLVAMVFGLFGTRTETEVFFSVDADGGVVPGAPINEATDYLLHRTPRK